MSRDLIIKWLLETVNMVWNLKYLWILFRKMCCIKLKVKITKLKLVGDDQKNIKLYMTFLVKNQSNDIQHVPDWISSKIVSQSKKNPIISLKKKRLKMTVLKYLGWSVKAKLHHRCVFLNFHCKTNLCKQARWQLCNRKYTVEN